MKFLRLLSLSPVFALFVMATLRADESPGLYELRTYEAHEGKLDALHQRFRDHTLRLFKKHGMTNIAYWVPVENEGRRLIYLLGYPDRVSRDQSWEAFLKDPEWQAAYATSTEDGKLVAEIESLFLTPTDFSPALPDASAEQPRQFEMRTYTTLPGKRDDIDARFRDHTMALFAKHGMTNLPYFHLVEGQEAAEVTLLYFLAHDNDAARVSSFDAFRNDPEWVAARDESEKDGPILIQGGVASLLLEAVDYSPLK